MTGAVLMCEKVKELQPGFPVDENRIAHRGKGCSVFFLSDREIRLGCDVISHCVHEITYMKQHEIACVKCIPKKMKNSAKMRSVKERTSSFTLSENAYCKLSVRNGQLFGPVHICAD